MLIKVKGKEKNQPQPPVKDDTEYIDITDEDFEEQRHFDMGGVKLRGSDKERFEAIGEGCNRYLPCPICYKCMNKASHMFEKCNKCEIPFCAHNDSQRNFMIRRENFTQKISEGLSNRLKEVEKQLHTTPKEEK